jgi:hypothetical protein
MSSFLNKIKILGKLMINLCRAALVTAVSLLSDKTEWGMPVWRSIVSNSKTEIFKVTLQIFSHKEDFLEHSATRKKPVFHGASMHSPKYR